MRAHRFGRIDLDTSGNTSRTGASGPNIARMARTRGAARSIRETGSILWSFRCGGGESSRERGGEEGTGLVVGLAVGGLGATGAFLDGFEFVQEVDPADGVFFAAFQARAAAVEGGGARLGGAGEIDLSKLCGGWEDGAVPAGCGVEEADVADAVEAVLEGGEGGALGEEHEDSVETFVEEGVLFGFEELETKICWALAF